MTRKHADGFSAGGNKRSLDRQPQYSTQANFMVLLLTNGNYSKTKVEGNELVSVYASSEFLTKPKVIKSMV